MQSAQSAATHPQAEPKQAEAPKISDEIQNLIELSHIAITGNDREGLNQLYAQLQGHYRGASKEEKVLIYKEVQQIHARLAK